ncbi:MAG: hypothetical protein Q7V10_00535 [Methanobacteriaceae archaeon]|nr:hypothetical protein [Methanobacteriaceae archaeon]MDO9627965.1 hypothetical protein [Methanobacteriaceae archaeon]
MNERQESKIMALKFSNSLSNSRLNSNDASHSYESSKIMKIKLSQYGTQFEILGDDI